MSNRVTRRLAELAEQGEQRRRRMSAVRRDSLQLLAITRKLRDNRVHQRDALASRAGVALSAVDAEPPHHDILGQVRALLGGDVLEQVRRLLYDVDEGASERWSEDDTCILVCFQQVWTAAVRRGYSLEDLQAILRAMRPRE